MTKGVVQSIFIVLVVASGMLSQEPPGKSQDRSNTGIQASSAVTTTTSVSDQTFPNYKYEAKGRRDPFRSLDVTVDVLATAAPVVRPPGLKGQMVSELKLVGIVRKKAGLMAIAEGYRGKTYFVYANDDLYDGKVLDIKNDAVMLNQFLTDSNGKKVSRQVVKRLYPTRGDGNNAK